MEGWMKGEWQNDACGVARSARLLGGARALGGRFGVLGETGALFLDILAQTFPDVVRHLQKDFNDLGIELAA
jgi:hypothetical protein